MSKQIGKMHNGISYIVKHKEIITNDNIKLLDLLVKYEPKDDLAYFYIKKLHQTKQRHNST
jgi:hypothetical protein